MILACLTVMAGFTFTVIAARRTRAGVYCRVIVFLLHLKLIMCPFRLWKEGVAA